MRAINHALTGAIIGIIVGEPLIAAPLAIASHFVLDVIPHHGQDSSKQYWLKSKAFRYLIYLDAFLCAVLVLTLSLYRPNHWPLAAICAFLAAAPDLLSINHYQKVLAGKHWKAGWYTAFAGRIQWFERPIGAVVEVAWLIATLILIFPLLKS